MVSQPKSSDTVTMGATTGARGCAMSLGYGGVCRKAPDEERLFQQHSNETEYARYKHDLTNGSPITVKPVLRGGKGVPIR